MWKLISGMSLTFAAFAGVVADETPPKPNVQVQFCGRMRHGVMSIGGETTGTTISVSRIIWELQLHTDADRAFATAHHKKTVVVTGRLRKVSGIETKDRWIVDVKKLAEQDPAKNKTGVRIAIAGKLRTADSGKIKAAPMTIDSAGQVWPIDFGQDPKLKATAETLLGQPAFLMGTLQQPADEESGTQPVIRVTTLKSPPSPQPPAPRPNDPQTEPLAG